MFFQSYDVKCTATFFRFRVYVLCTAYMMRPNNKTQNQHANGTKRLARCDFLLLFSSYLKHSLQFPRNRGPKSVEAKLMIPGTSGHRWSMLLVLIDSQGMTFN